MIPRPFRGLSPRRLMASPGMHPRMRPFARMAIIGLYPGLLAGAFIDLLVMGMAMVLVVPVRWSRRRTGTTEGPRRRAP